MQEPAGCYFGTETLQEAIIAYFANTGASEHHFGNFHLTC